jgi:integrase
MIVSLHGRQYRKSIGVGLPPKYWSTAKHRAKVTADFDGKPINEAIEHWEEIGRQAVRKFEYEQRTPTPEEFAKAISELSDAGMDGCGSLNTSYFCDYIEKVYIPRYALVRDKRTVIKYEQALRKLREFEEYTRSRLRITDINIDFYNRFQHWFYEKGYSRNYFGNVVNIVKQTYRESRENDRLHDEHGTDHRDFIAPKDPVDNVYLDLDELKLIHDLDIEKAILSDTVSKKAKEGDNIPRRIAALERARGLFLIGCYTGLRVSDFSRLRDAHIGRFITIKTQKTGTSVVIPIHPVVREIINRGFDLSDTITDQKLNGHIKELCRLAGITQEVLINRNVGGQNVEVVMPKYQLVSSHTARRSFATNAYKSGVPTIAIMKITGHTKESTFLKYIKVSAQENADMLSRHPFFANSGK